MTDADKAPWDVLGCGVVSIDELLYVEHYPPPDSKVLVVARDRQGGGLTGTALVAAARVGARCAFGGVLGSDELSEMARDELMREGVDCSAALRKPEARPCHSVIIVDRSTGSRNIFFSRDGVMTRSLAEITPALIARCRVMFVDNLDLDSALRMAEVADSLGIPVVSDLEYHEYARTAELFSHIHHLIAAENFALRLTGAVSAEEAVISLAQRHPRACTAVTAGERGCWFIEGRGPLQYQPAFRVPVVDTTGCGDVFHGAYAACLARGIGVAECIRFASATAALKATQPGGRAGIPDRATVERFLRER
jgi:sulfofructose kinase